MPQRRPRHRGVHRTGAGHEHLLNPARLGGPTAMPRRPWSVLTTDSVRIWIGFHRFHAAEPGSRPAAPGGHDLLSSFVATADRACPTPSRSLPSALGLRPAPCCGDQYLFFFENVREVTTVPVILAAVGKLPIHSGRIGDIIQSRAYRQSSFIETKMPVMVSFFQSRTSIDSSSPSAPLKP